MHRYLTQDPCLTIFSISWRTHSPNLAYKAKLLNIVIKSIAIPPTSDMSSLHHHRSGHTIRQVAGFFCYGIEACSKLWVCVYMRGNLKADLGNQVASHTTNRQ